MTDPSDVEELDKILRKAQRRERLTPKKRRVEAIAKIQSHARQAVEKELADLKKEIGVIPKKYMAEARENSMWSAGYNDAAYEMKGKIIDRLSKIRAERKQ